MLLSAVSSGADSKLFLIVTRKIAEAWSVLPDSTGAGAFPNANVNGGSIGGIPIVVVDETVDGEIILIDASQVAAGQDGFVLDSSQQASVQLDTVPDSPPSRATSSQLVAGRLAWSASRTIYRRESYAQRLRGQNYRRAIQRKLACLTMTTAAHILDQMTKQPYDDDVWFKKVFLPTIGKYIAAQVRPLQKRIEELENKTANWKYVGTFKSGEVYHAGNFCTFGGSLWHCQADTLAAPGTDETWQLCVKRGKDAR